MTGLGSSCGACKFLRRKCTTECVFAPYFSYEQAASHFSAVHKVFGASNVSKLLLQLPVQCRSDAAITISFEALARMQDPVYGCVAQIFALQQQIVGLQEEIEILGHQMANFTVGIATDGNLNYGDAMNSQCHQSQLGAPPSSGYTPENQAFDDQMVLQLEHSFEFEDRSLCCDFQANPLGMLVQGMDQEFLPYCPQLGSANNAN